MFGKLIVNNEKATINEDINCRLESSDLHLCAYFPTPLLYSRDPNRAIISVRLSKESDTHMILHRDLGPDLKIFRTSFSDIVVSLLGSLPGLKAPSLMFSSNTIQGDIQFDFTSKSFTKHITLKRKSQNYKTLINNTKINIEQTSPYITTITYATFHHTCNFPFPIIDNATRLRVSRANGWMEVITPLISESKHISIPFPLQRSDSTITTWNLPYINFHLLPKLDMTDPNSKVWKQLHLLSIFINHKMPLHMKRVDTMTSIKNSIHAMLAPTKHIIRLKSGTQSITFLMDN